VHSIGVCSRWGLIAYFNGLGKRGALVSVRGCYTTIAFDPVDYQRLSSLHCLYDGKSRGLST